MSEFFSEEFIWTIDTAGWDSARFGAPVVNALPGDPNEGIFETFYFDGDNYFDTVHYVGQVTSITSATLGDSMEFDSPTISVSGDPTLYPAGIAPTLAFGTATVTGTTSQIIGAGGIAGDSQTGTFSVTYVAEWIITTTGIAPTVTFGTANVSSTAVFADITAGNIASTLVFGVPEITTEGSTDIECIGIPPSDAFGTHRVRTPGWVRQARDTATWNQA